MTFAAWQSLAPAAAARELHDRARTRLRPGQARAVLGWLLPEAELAGALAEARSHAAGLLAGVPFFAKDLFDVAGRPTFAGSTFLPDVRGIPERDSAFVASVRATGAVLAGKTHMHEFAYGITGENAHYGDCEHPHFPGRTTGGSSSGSVAAVAAGLVPLALGSDTGGSVRVPAAFCGLYGFRLTPGDAWIRDAFPLAPTFDTAGWFTADAGDLRTTLAALLGLGAAPAREPRGCSLELAGLDAEVGAAFRAAAARFAAPAPATVAGALRHAFAGALDSYNTTVAQEAWQVHAPWAERFRDRYSPAVWQRLIRAHALTPAQIASADRTRAAVRAAWAEYFRDYDFLVLPGTPAPAFTKAECTLENRNRLLTLTAPASLGGLPVLTVPVPLAGGLTTGLQIVVRDPQSPAVMWALER